MIKKIYNTMLVFVLCISVFMMDMGMRGNSLRFGITKVQAAQTLTTGGGDTIDELKSNLIIAVISLLSINMPITYSRSGVDVVLGVIGGLLYIAGSISSTEDLKKAMKEISQKIARKDGGELTDSQRQSLVNLRDSYNKAKDSADKKKQFQEAAVIAYMLAAVVATCMAVFVSYGEALSLAGCEASIQSKVMIFIAQKPIRLIAFTAVFALMGITNPAVIGASFLLNETFASAIHNVMCSTAARAVTWTVFSMFATQAVQDTQKQIVKLEEDVTKINSVLTTMAQQADGSYVQASTTTAGNGNGGVNTTIQGNGQTAPTLAAEAVQFPCGGRTIAGGPCPNLVNEYNAQPQASGIPSNIGAQIGSIVRLGSAYNGSNTAAANLPSPSGSIGNSAAIKAFLGQQKELLQKKLLENGSKYNLANEEAKLFKTIKDTADKAIKEKMTPADIAAAMSGMGNDKELKDKLEATKLANLNPNLLNSSLGVNSATKPKIKIGEIKLEEKPADQTASVEAKAAPKSMDEFDLKNDINSEKGPSIFEIISNRYQMSGYPRLFKRIQE